MKKNINKKNFSLQLNCNSARKHLACSNAIISIALPACLPGDLPPTHSLCALRSGEHTHIRSYFGSLSFSLTPNSQFVRLCTGMYPSSLPLLLLHHSNCFFNIFSISSPIFLSYFFLFDLVLAREQCIKL